MFYVDTSALVAAIVREPDSEGIRLWLAAQSLGDVAISEWVLTEFSSALALKVRTRQLDLESRTLAISYLSKATAESLIVLPIEPAHFRAAARIAGDSQNNIRAGDALHLAVAQAYSATLCTRDAGFSTAAQRLGVAVNLM